MRSSFAIVAVATLFVAGCNAAALPTVPSSMSAPMAGASSSGSRTVGALGILAAPSVPTHADGATVLSIQAPCHFFNGDGVWSMAIGDCDFHLVFAANGDVATVTVRGQTTPASNGQSAHFDTSNTGIQCTIDDTSFATDDWQETVAASGAVTVHCSFH